MGISEYVQQVSGYDAYLSKQKENKEEMAEEAISISGESEESCTDRGRAGKMSVLGLWQKETHGYELNAAKQKVQRRGEEQNKDANFFLSFCVPP